MPVTRSSSRQTSQQPSSQPYLSRAEPSGIGGTKKASPSNEIIVLSSDDDKPPPKGTLVSKKSKLPGRTSKRKAAPLALSRDVLEISSSDESKQKKSPTRKKAQSAEAMNKDLERTIKKLQGDLERTEQLLATSSREVEELKRDFYNKDVFAGMEEHTLCEVCTLTMWCPYTLPECGHSFCEKCLVDWFTTTQAQHIAANPQLDDGRAALVGQLHAFVQMVPNLHAYGPHGQQHVRAVLAELRRYRPDYTCPSCRKEVVNKPVEDFRLKNLINHVAGLMGEINSRKDVLVHRKSGSAPFDHFFAAPIMAR